MTLVLKRDAEMEEYAKLPPHPWHGKAQERLDIMQNVSVQSNTRDYYARKQICASINALMAEHVNGRKKTL